MKKLLLFVFIIIFNSAIASDYSIEDVDQFLKDGLITEEEYEVLKGEILGVGDTNTAYLYEITMNSTLRNNSFKAKLKNKKVYFPILEFFSIINLKSYDLKDRELKALLGEELLVFNINLKSKRVEIGDEKISYEDEVFFEDEEIFIESDLFAKILTKDFEKNDNSFKIKTTLKFKTPYEIKNQIENRLDRFEEENNKNLLVYTHEKEFFDLGYLKTKIDYNYAEKSKEGDWSSTLEYQGGFLYGELTTSYDVKENQVGDVTVYYPEVYKGHSMEVGSYGTTERELGFSFRKEKGYFTVGDELVIRENVSIGSRVELIYLGFPIDAKDSENGVIEFSGPEVRRDRDYSLKVYAADGTISIIDISTNKSYNQQKKGELEYDINVREELKTESYKGDANVYYGLGDNLTLSMGVERSYEETDENESTEDIEYKGITAFNPEIIYGDSYKKNEYTFVLGSEYVDEERKIDYLETELNIKKLKLRSKFETYGDFYSEKFKERYTAEYSLSKFQIIYNYSNFQYKEKERQIDYDTGVNYNVAFKNLLVTTDYRIDRDSNEDYSVSGYYTGHYLFNSRLTNRWKNNGKDYTTTLSISNKDLTSAIDYSLEFDYSNRGEQVVGIKFRLDLDNWFKFGINSPASRDTTYTVGINKIVDLKNITKNIETMDSSRVKIITFLDDNNNNIYDEGERKLPYNEIKIGQKDVITDENGEAWLYGVSNNILYDMDLKIQRPSYTVGENKLKVQGRRVGTIEAYIPIKSKVNLVGELELVGQNLTASEKVKLMQELSVRVKDPEGNLLEKLAIEEDGMFLLSEIYPGDYDIEVLYWG
ncbi:hypothetical protein, partial [Cetobacterium sp.]|uniref:hypothetical protein n=1 Tax=Cetobacterium sp. TaxID=2071632 RepID=UPI003F2C587D